MLASRRKQRIVAVLPDRVLVSQPLAGNGELPVFEFAAAIENGAGHDWQPSLNALGVALTEHVAAKTTITVWPSLQYARIGLSPERSAKLTRAEREAVARHDLAQRYGACGDDWAVRMSEAGPMDSRIVTAFEQSFIDHIERTVRDSGHGAPSIQPWFTWVLSASVGKLPSVSDAWLLFSEPGYTVVGLFVEGQWRSLQGYRLRDGASADFALLRAALSCRLTDPPMRAVLFGVDPSAQSFLSRAGYDTTSMEFNWNAARTSVPPSTTESGRHVSQN